MAVLVVLPLLAAMLLLEKVLLGILLLFGDVKVTIIDYLQSLLQDVGNFNFRFI